MPANPSPAARSRSTPLLRRLWRVRFTDGQAKQSHRPFWALEEEQLASSRAEAIALVQAVFRSPRYTDWRASVVRMPQED